MTALGTSFIVLGVAFLFRGLIFMLSKPFGRKPVQPSARQKSFKESQERTAYYLQQIRARRTLGYEPSPFVDIEFYRTFVSHF